MSKVINADRDLPDIVKESLDALEKRIAELGEEIRKQTIFYWTSDPNLSISQLKKRIKYCRNPLEKQSLQRELNNLYKKRRRGH